MKRFSIRNETIEPVSVGRNLGVLYDEHHSMNSNILRTCFFQIAATSCSSSAAWPWNYRMASVCICSTSVQIRLLQCSSDLTTGYYSGASSVNASARLILDLKPEDHVTSGLKELHWLPIRQRIEYKLCFPSTCLSMTKLHVIDTTSWRSRRLGLGRRDTGRFLVGRWPSKNIISINWCFLQKRSIMWAGQTKFLTPGLASHSDSAFKQDGLSSEFQPPVFHYSKFHQLILPKKLISWNDFYVSVTDLVFKFALIRIGYNFCKGLTLTSSY